jgi:parvulin-like peptidyl-prolyl isomerase
MTSVPLALSVNGEGITQAEFNAEMARYQSAQTALGKTVSPEQATQAVQDDLIDSLLLAQGAQAYKFNVDETMVAARSASLTAQLGGANALSAWESAHGYTDESFRTALAREIASAWMRDEIAASVPTIAEQVHVKQILLYNAGDAQSVLAKLQAGANFNDLAAEYDPVGQGDMGWFPRGYLPEAAIETAAFGLQVGQYSAIIQTQVGYHILLLVEREPARPLSPDALLTLQQHALQSWLAQRRQESTITLSP